MLIEMSVGNFLSFKEPVKISMIAANSVKEHKNSNIIETENYKLLKSSVLYGANASGKSNLIKAMTFMKWFVISSSKDTQTHERIPVTPYKLSRETSGKPSFFEIVILKNKIKYRYGFELDSHGVKWEWLLFSEKKKEYELFLRDEQDFEIFPKFKEGEKLESKTRGNALFLSVVAQFNGEISEEILEWFNDLQIITGLDYKPYKDVSESMLRSDKYRKNLIELLKIADTGIESCSIEEKEKISIPVKNGVFKTGNDIFTMNLSYEKSNVDTLHKIIDDEENRAPEFIEFDLENDESEGTKKFLYIIGPILKAIIENTVLIVDELDARLHPILTMMIIKAFQSLSGKNNGQMIFSTHDTNLLDQKVFRRDQIWFFEKRTNGASDLYSLVEYKKTRSKKVRNDESLEKNYIHGKYGAIPYIGDFENLLRGLKKGK